MARRHLPSSRPVLQRSLPTSVAARYGVALPPLALVVAVVTGPDQADIVRKAIRMHPDASTDEIWEAETEAFAALDALVAERDEWEAALQTETLMSKTWRKEKVAAEAEVERLREALTVYAGRTNDYEVARAALGEDA